MDGTDLDAHPGLGDYAQDPFAAQGQTVRAGAGAAARQPPGFNNARGSQHAHRLYEIVDVGMIRRVMAAGTGGDPASQRGKLEALGKVPQGKSAGAQLVLQRRTEDPSLYSRRPGYVVYFQDLVQRRDINGYRAVGVWGRFNTAYHRTAPAVGNGYDSGAGTPLQYRFYLPLVAWMGHHVYRVWEVAVERPHAVAEVAAVAMQRPVMGVSGANLRQA